jgi:hypothetical protein
MQKCHCGQVIFDPFKTKPQGGNTFLKIRPFLTQGSTLEAGLSATPAQKLLLRGCTSPENFTNILSFLQKFFTFLQSTDRQTDRQTFRETHTPPSIHPYTRGSNFNFKWLPS